MRALGTAFVTLLLVQAGASFGAAPAGAPAGTTGLCKDGSYWSGATKKGACKGHKGVKEWYGAATEAAAPAAASAAPAKPAAAAPPSPAAAAPPAPAGTTGLCKDGSYWSGATKKGACKGHKGVKEWYGAATEAAAPAAASAAPAKPAAAAPPPPAAAAPPAASTAPAAAAKTPAQATTASASTQAAAAPGGGPGKVWVNKSSKVYHCPGTRWYGKTKEGEYMSEAEATSQGFKPDHGKACK